MYFFEPSGAFCRSARPLWIPACTLEPNQVSRFFSCSAKVSAISLAFSVIASTDFMESTVSALRPNTVMPTYTFSLLLNVFLIAAAVCLIKPRSPSSCRLLVPSSTNSTATWFWSEGAETIKFTVVSWLLFKLSANLANRRLSKLTSCGCGSWQDFPVSAANADGTMPSSMMAARIPAKTLCFRMIDTSIYTIGGTRGASLRQEAHQGHRPIYK